MNEYSRPTPEDFFRAFLEANPATGPKNPADEAQSAESRQKMADEAKATSLEIADMAVAVHKKFIEAKVHQETANQMTVIFWHSLTQYLFGYK